MAIPDWITIATSDKSGGTGTSSTTKSISIKASENKSLSSRTGTITFKPSHGNSKTVSITQNAGVYSFGALSSSLTYSTDTVPASGGTLSSYTIWWSLPYGWNGSSSNAGTMNSSNYTNYSGVSLSSWSWSSSSSSVSVSGGKATIPSAGTSVSSSVVNMATITATATLTIAAGSVFGNSSAKTFTIKVSDVVYRAANTATTSAVELIAYQPDDSWHSVTNGQWDVVPARGMCLAAQKRYKIAYSSGEYEYTSPEIISTYNLSWSNSSMIQYHEWYGYDMVRVISRGTTVGDALSNTCTYTEGSLSASLTFTQEANRATGITYGTPSVSLSCSDIPAMGGSISSGSVSYSQSRTQSYTSGATSSLSTLTSGGTISYSSAVSADSLGCDIKARSSVGTLTATVTMNGKSGSKSVAVYQAHNTIIEVGCNVEGYEDKSVGAGSTAVSPSCYVSQDFKYSSTRWGSEIPSSTYGTFESGISYTLESDDDGFSLQSMWSGNVSVSENKSLSSRSATVYAHGSCTWTPKSQYDFDGRGYIQSSRTAAFSITQSAGSYSYSSYSVTASASTTSISASGGSATINASASRTYGWNGSTSGAGTQTSNVSLSILSGSGASLSGATVTFSNNTSTSSRSVVVRVTCANDTSKYKDITFTQAAGSKVYSSWGGGAISFNSTSALSAGSDSRTVTIQPWTRTWTWNGTGSATTEYYTGSVTLSENGSYTSLNTTSYTASSSAKSVTLSKSTCGTTITSATNVTVTASGATTTTKAISQSANTASYVYGDVNIGIISNPDAPASGGESAMATAFSGSQTIKTIYTSGSSKEESVTIEPSVHAIEVEDIPSLGTTIKARTLLKSQDVTWTGQGGKSASSTLYIYQEANKIESTTYGEPTFYFTPSMMLDVPASGAGGNIQFSVSQNRTYTYTSEATSTSQIIPSYTTSFASSQPWATAKSSSSGFTITIAKNETTSSRSGKLNVWVTANGVTAAKEFEYSQKAGASVTTLVSDPSSIYTSYAANQIDVVISMEVNGAHTQFDSEDDLIISSYPSWVTKISSFLDTGDILLVVFVTKNPTTSQRSGNIIIRMADGSASLSIPISQGYTSTSSSNYSKIRFAIENATSVPSMMYENLGIICSDYQDPDYGDYDCVPIGTYSSGTATFNNNVMRCLVSSDTLRAVNVKESISMLDDSMDIYLAAFPDGFSETAYCIARIDSLSDIISALDDVAANGDTALYVTGILV